MNCVTLPKEFIEQLKGTSEILKGIYGTLEEFIKDIYEAQ